MSGPVPALLYLGLPDMQWSSLPDVTYLSLSSCYQKFTFPFTKKISLRHEDSEACTP